jgi:hypothetical protein
MIWPLPWQRPDHDHGSGIAVARPSSQIAMIIAVGIRR